MHVCFAYSSDTATMNQTMQQVPEIPVSFCSEEMCLCVYEYARDIANQQSLHRNHRCGRCTVYAAVLVSVSV